MLVGSIECLLSAQNNKWKEVKQMFVVYFYSIFTLQVIGCTIWYIHDRIQDKKEAKENGKG